MAWQGTHVKGFEYLMEKGYLKTLIAFPTLADKVYYLQPVPILHVAGPERVRKKSIYYKQFHQRPYYVIDQ